MNNNKCLYCIVMSEWFKLVIQWTWHKESNLFFVNTFLLFILKLILMLLGPQIICPSILGPAVASAVRNAASGYCEYAVQVYSCYAQHLYCLIHVELIVGK